MTKNYSTRVVFVIKENLDLEIPRVILRQSIAIIVASRPPSNTLVPSTQTFSLTRPPIKIDDDMQFGLFDKNEIKSK